MDLFHSFYDFTSPLFSVSYSGSTSGSEIISSIVMRIECRCRVLKYHLRANFAYPHFHASSPFTLPPWVVRPHDDARWSFTTWLSTNSGFRLSLHLIVSLIEPSSIASRFCRSCLYLLAIIIFRGFHLICYFTRVVISSRLPIDLTKVSMIMTSHFAIVRIPN